MDKGIKNLLIMADKMDFGDVYLEVFVPKNNYGLTEGEKNFAAVIGKDALYLCPYSLKPKKSIAPKEDIILPFGESFNVNEYTAPAGVTLLITMRCGKAIPLFITAKAYEAQGKAFAQQIKSLMIHNNMA